MNSRISQSSLQINNLPFPKFFENYNFFLQITLFIIKFTF